MHDERLLLIALVVGGCGGGFPTTRTGVHQRVVATVPTEHIELVPAHAPRPGHVRVGIAGGVPFARENQTPKPTEGARVEPTAYGEAFVAVGMPGHYHALDSDATAGWELVGGVIAAPAPSSRSLDGDPALTVADRGIVGGSLGVTGAIGDRDFTFAGSLTIRDVALPYVWDWGDCAGGSGCPIWTSKGGPVQGVERVVGVSSALGMRKRMQGELAFLAGAGFDVAPTFEVSQRASVMCDANGNCSGGRRPETPVASHAGLAYGLLGFDAEPSRFGRAYVIVVPLTSGEERRVQLRVGIEASF